MTTIYTSKDVLLSAINSKLDLELDLSKYDLHNLESLQGDFNTGVTIIPLLGSGIYNTSSFKYNRMDLGGFGTVKVKISNSTKVSDIITLIAEAGGISTIFTADAISTKVNITMADLVEQTLPVITEVSVVNISVEASESSYLFYGTLKLALSL